jgi:hypothetical protein
MERLKNGPPVRMFKKMRLYFELMICDKYRGKNTGRQIGHNPGLLLVSLLDTKS